MSNVSRCDRACSPLPVRLGVLCLCVVHVLGGNLFGQETPTAPPGVASTGTASIGSASIGTASTLPAAPQILLTAREHPWGRFHPKSWIHTQTLSWTVQDGPLGARVASVREMKTTLESIDPDSVTLKKEATVNMGGKQIKTTPQIERFDFYQEPVEDDKTVQGVGTGKLLVNNLVIPCKKRVYEKKNASEKSITTLWYTTQLYPYVLRAETVLVALPTENEPVERELRRSVTEVFESSSFLLRRSKEGAYRYRTKMTEGKMTTLTEATCSHFVPGGVIHETVRELDDAGNEIRTAETRLINFFRMMPPPHAAPTAETTLSGQPAAVPEPYPFGPMPPRPRWRRFYPLPYSMPYALPAPSHSPQLAPPSENGTP